MVFKWCEIRNTEVAISNWSTAWIPSITGKVTDWNPWIDLFHCRLAPSLRAVFLERIYGMSCCHSILLLPAQCPTTNTWRLRLATIWCHDKEINIIPCTWEWSQCCVWSVLHNDCATAPESLSPNIHLHFDQRYRWNGSMCFQLPNPSHKTDSAFEHKLSFGLDSIGHITAGLFHRASNDTPLPGRYREVLTKVILLFWKFWNHRTIICA